MVGDRGFEQFEKPDTKKGEVLYHTYHFNHHCFFDLGGSSIYHYSALCRQSGLWNPTLAAE